MKFQAHSDSLAPFIASYEFTQRLLSDPDFKLITDSLPYGLIILNKRGLLAFMNAAAERINQLSLSSQKDVPFRRFVRVSAVDCTDILKSYQQMTSLHCTSSSNNGEAMQVTTKSLPDKNGHPAYFVITQNTVSEKNFRPKHSGSASGFKSVTDREDALKPETYLLDYEASGTKFVDKGIRAMKMNSRILITGESGAGKTSSARYIHGQVMAPDKPFIHVNCASIPNTLFESELFGYEKGAFTGAHQRGKKGFLEAADGGTLFLDEIGEIPLESQPKLLQFLETNTVQRLGTTATKTINVRIISATNKDLSQMIIQGKFRQDLYYRLCVIELNTPPLRDTKQCIPKLIEHHIDALIQRRGTPFRLSKQCYRQLLEYHYPGNIRELHNILEHLAVECDDIAEIEHLPNHIKNQHDVDDIEISHLSGLSDNGPSKTLKKIVQDFESKVIRIAIDKHGSKRQAALALGVDVATVTRKTQRTA